MASQFKMAMNGLPKKDNNLLPYATIMQQLERTAALHRTICSTAQIDGFGQQLLRLPRCRCYN
eukprot:scaffold19704_cov21-Prasinocladus_malaysianus.AAC.1